MEARIYENIMSKDLAFFAPSTQQELHENFLNADSGVIYQNHLTIAQLISMHGIEKGCKIQVSKDIDCVYSVEER